ncbi:signal transduction histidine kinase [Amycolatopsis bartoniae]|uniref:sensor histidine kinase n=1 Tax=Amycolatopsis bartoniae TaxID=941986 RepID=UPI00179CAA7D|nr:sensor histidine kinase [Amycolatopsis bartoniae]MBB2934928.1 signal transduction histidine kinase [Amycolatopsis bartoniae]
MPADVPVVEQPVNAWQRYHWLWHVLFVTDYVATVGLLSVVHASPTQWLVSFSALTAIGALYVVLGRKDPEGWQAGVFGALVLVLAVVAILSNAAAGLALFSVCPMLFMATPLPVAVLMSVPAIMAPVLSVLVDQGADSPVLNSLLPMCVMFVVFGVCIGQWFTRVVRQSEERADLIEQLEASRAEVSRLSHEAGTSAERERLAREIHDTLAQGFTSIVTLLQAVESEWDDAAAVRRHVALAGRTARENLTEARAMVAALTPAALGAGTLEDAVRRQADRFAEETGVEVVCEVPGPLPALRTATEVVLLRAAQESLTNVRKHAEARHVSLELVAAEGKARLTVRDDGRGFEPGSADGFGLAGMRARAEQVGGCLSVRSGQGTTVVVEVPA